MRGVWRVLLQIGAAVVVVQAMGIVLHAIRF